MEHDYIIYWWASHLKEWCLETYGTEQEAMDKLTDYAKRYPHNTYVLCKVVGIQTATLPALQPKS